MTARVALLVAVAIAAHAGSASAGPCTSGGTIVSYDKPLAINPAAKDTRCDFDAFGRCVAIDLKGYLYTPPATFTGARPLIVFEHGNSGDGTGTGPFCAIADWFTARGYVVFVAHRRGAGLSTGVTSNEYTADGWCTTASTSDCGAQYLALQVADVVKAVGYAPAIKRPDGTAWVDQGQVSVIGHSGGGIVALLANTSSQGLRGVVAIGAAAVGWNASAMMRADLIAAVQSAARPMFILQPANDVSTDPTAELGLAAGDAYKVHQTALFPPVCSGACDASDWTSSARHTAHGVFPTAQIDAWGPIAIEFLDRNPP